MRWGPVSIHVSPASSGAAAGADSPCAAAASRSTSSSVTRPPGPVGLTFARSTPSSRARLRAAGDTGVRPPVRDERCRRATDPAAIGAGAGAAGCAAATIASSSSSLTVSPGELSTATGAVTGTFSPSVATMRRSTPSWGASTSLVALSVSTVNSGSPALTSSPSARSHSVTVPSFIRRPHFGIATIVGMKALVPCFRNWMPVKRPLAPPRCVLVTSRSAAARRLLRPSAAFASDHSWCHRISETGH